MEVITATSRSKTRSKTKGKWDLNANQKDRLGFASVRHQIYEAQRLGYTEDENVSGVIQNMYSGLWLKSIFEI